MKRIRKCLGIFLLLILLFILGYAAYVYFSYSRIEDRVALDVQGNAKEAEVRTETEYTIFTQNLGFGAYTADFTFFMDGGKESRAESAESVKENTEMGAQTALSQDADFIFYQEVDTDSTRSHHVDQSAILSNFFRTEYCSDFAVNYHSAYLPVPLWEPHGKSNSGLLTLSRYQVSDAIRKSFPVDTGLSKFLDLDRCYAKSRIPVEGGKELILYNAHLSAYGAGSDLKKEQINLLFTDMKEECVKGNYVIAGGDFNSDFTGDSGERLNGTPKEVSWTLPFPDELIPEGIIKQASYMNSELIPTCRDCDIPYGPENFVVIVDGFFTSENVEAVSVENVDTGFVYTDHNPVVMKFILK